MLVTDIKQIDGWARKNFIYEATEWELYHWRSHYDDVISGRSWRGPCADLTSTVMDMMTRGGGWVPYPAPSLSDCYRLLVSTTGDPKPDHTVGCIVTGDDGMWIVGDTFGTPYPHHLMQHRGLTFNRLSETGDSPIWRIGCPWNVVLPA